MPIWKNLPPNARVLIIRGHGGRDFLADKLTELGFQIDIAEIYFRRPHAIDWQNFKTEGIAACSHPTNSRANFSIRFRRNFPDSSIACYTLPHHPRIADALRIVGAKHAETVTSLSCTFIHAHQRAKQ